MGVKHQIAVPGAREADPVQGAMLLYPFATARHRRFPLIGWGPGNRETVIPTPDHHSEHQSENGAGTAAPEVFQAPLHLGLPPHRRAISSSRPSWSRIRCTTKSTSSLISVGR